MVLSAESKGGLRGEIVGRSAAPY